MAMTNVTADTEKKSFVDNYCSTELAGGRKTQLMVLLALNIFVSVTAFLGNALILAALHKESSLHPPSKRLYRTLVTTDLAVGIIAGPLIVAYLISVLNKHLNICRFTFKGFLITGYTLCGVSLLTLTAISVDRLFALLLGLRYRQVVTLKRISVIVRVFWSVCIIVSTMHLWTYRRMTDWLGSIVISLCLVTSVFSYAKIFFDLRPNRDQERGQENNQNVQPNRARYKKTVYTALWVQLTLIVCFLPYNIMVFIVFQRGISPSLAISLLFAATLVLLNSSLNPLLYCWKLREVRQAVKDIVKGMFSSSS